MNRMRVFVLGFIMMASFSSCAPPDAEPKASMPQGPSAPDFTLTDIAGKRVSLGDFAGKSPVLIDFWASWCAPCIDTIPEIIELRARYSPEELQILGVNVQDTRETAARFASEYGINYTVLLDYDGQVARSFGILGIPTMFLVDTEGRVVSKAHSLSRGLLEDIERVVSK